MSEKSAVLLFCVGVFAVCYAAGCSSDTNAGHGRNDSGGAGGFAGSSANGGMGGGAPPLAEFEGVWIVSDDGSVIDCPMEVGLRAVPFAIVSSTVTIQAGVLTDLVETDTSCRFSYDVMGMNATMPTVDPYTGKAPTCTIVLSTSDGANVVLAPRATPAWTFRLLMPVTGKAPEAQISGAADATLTLADSNGNLQKLTPCVFDAQLNLHKNADP